MREGEPREQRVVLSNEAVRDCPQGFPRAARLLKAGEFTILFRMRPIRRSEHFVVYMRPREAPESSVKSSASSEAACAVTLPGRMGLVLGRKSAPRAATRNMVRRALRETFRMRRAEFEGWDVLIRMHQRFDKQRFPGAASPALKRACRAEVTALLDEVGRQIGRRRNVSNAAANTHGVAPVPNASSTSSVQDTPTNAPHASDSAG